MNKRDVISNAIEAGWHNTKRERIKKQDWSLFEREVIGKKLFLFGCGDGAEYFCQRYLKFFEVEGIVDNDSKKQGLNITDCIFSVEKAVFNQREILSSAELSRYGNDEIVVLITSLKYYDVIIEQLEKMGISNYFVLLQLERKERLSEEETIDFGELPIEDKKIVFRTMGGFAGHGKVITEVLLERRNDLDIVWVVNDLNLEVPEGVRLVYSKNTRKYLYEMSTAKCWVEDYLLPLIVNKRENQFFVEIKHWASITLKSFGFGLYQFRNDLLGMEACKRNGKMIDYILIGSKFDEETCRQGFCYDGEVVHVGSPRTDVLFKQEIKQQVYHFFDIDETCQLAIYAPTFRCGKGENKRFEVGSIGLDFQGLKKVLERKFGGHWKILLRLHPNVADESIQIQKADYIIDASAYQDGEELVAASDLMITDYSSIMFEPAFVKKPVFLYAPDKNDYIEGERELLIDYNQLPFPIAESNEELFTQISNYVHKEYIEKVDAFMNKYGVCEDGHASERAADFIINLIENSKGGR